MSTPSRLRLLSSFPWLIALAGLLTLQVPVRAQLGVDGTAPASAVATLDEGGVPRGDVFEPLWADPVWPQFRFTYNRYIDDDYLQNVVSFGIGDTVPFVRLVSHAPPGLDALEFGAQAAVFTTFDQDQPSSDQFNADFFGGVYLAGRRGPTSAMVRAIHRSSHLGDELLVNNPSVTRSNFSFERFDLLLSYDLAGTFGENGGPYARVYGGAGTTASSPSPREWERWRLQWGLELRSPETVGYFRPVAAVDVTQQQGNDFKLDVSVRAGVQVDRPSVPGRAVRFLVEYYNGKDVNGQFWEDDLQYVGFGIFFNF